MAVFSDLYGANNATLFTVTRKDGSTVEVVDSIVNANVERIKLSALSDHERTLLNEKFKSLNLPMRGW